MKDRKIDIHFQETESIEELSLSDQKILNLAKKAAIDAYAPYSNFSVGATIELEDGTAFCGSNQENAAYPSGLCAERVAIFAASANYPNLKIKSIAVYASDVDRAAGVISPCGACRQAIVEYEKKQASPIRILLMGNNGKIMVFKDIESLLPLSFSLKVSKKNK